MANPALSLTGTIKSEDDLRDQYKDSSNLNARAAIYRFLQTTIPWPTWVFDQMLEVLRSDAAVLEIGCGPGTLWTKNMPRIPADWRMLLTDLMAGMISEAKGGLAGDARFRFQQMDAQNLDLPDASVDGVIANHMLYHVPDLPKTISEIHRVLRAGGILFAATNGENHLRRINELIYEFLGDGSLMNEKTAFSLDNGERYLKSHFRRVELRRVPNELRITDTNAVVNYVLSAGSGAKEKIVGETLARLRARIEAEITSCGAFIVQTDSGLFVATK